MNDIFGRPIWYVDQLYSVNEHNPEYTHTLAAAWFSKFDDIPLLDMMLEDTLRGAFYGEVFDPDINYYRKVARILEHLLVFYLYLVLFIVMHLA
jgi:hypothetical protein